MAQGTLLREILTGESMAVLQAPSKPREAAASNSQRRRRPRQPMPLPVLFLGIMVVLALGFGAGSIVQFDRDWRTGTPRAVEAASGTITAGADLAQTVTELLSDKGLPVKHVSCAESAAVAGGAGTTSVVSGSGLVNPQMQLCRAQSTSGMVNIVAQRSGENLDVTVFLAE